MPGRECPVCLGEGEFLDMTIGGPVHITDCKNCRGSDRLPTLWEVVAPFAILLLIIGLFAWQLLIRPYL